MDPTLARCISLQMQMKFHYKLEWGNTTRKILARFSHFEQLICSNHLVFKMAYQAVRWYKQKTEQKRARKMLKVRKTSKNLSCSGTTLNTCCLWMYSFCLKQVAQRELGSFTHLIFELTRVCRTQLEKAR